MNDNEAIFAELRKISAWTDLQRKMTKWSLILKTPQYPEAHRRLAGAYLAAGKVEKASEHYAEAFRLFPSEENEKLLMAIERRSKAEQPNGAAGGSQPIRAETNRTSSAAGSRR